MLLCSLAVGSVVVGRWQLERFSYFPSHQASEAQVFLQPSCQGDLTPPPPSRRQTILRRSIGPEAIHHVAGSELYRALRSPDSPRGFN